MLLNQAMSHRSINNRGSFVGEIMDHKIMHECRKGKDKNWMIKIIDFKKYKL